MAWIRLPGLPRYLYKRKILEKIGGIIGKVVRLDLNTGSRIRGRFARLVVYVNLHKPLISKVLVNGVQQKVEYEALPTIYFSCGKYGHTKELCTMMQPEVTSEKIQDTVVPEKQSCEGGGTMYRLWMVIEKRSRSNPKNANISKADSKGKSKSGSRFDTLKNMETIDLEAGTNKGRE
ncbi:hypothetical protein GOBAR_AA27805 [Gossypium barbadense]|uniref:Uncharacterized protein n=1 Tax=Gossypium barbadense TaxID=3634 RepID=A0A2P5WPA8_GOSBA|nr:hypothetical protein GOBAR_AA27805 [Gossypium barbadense]